MCELLGYNLPFMAAKSSLLVFGEEAAESREYVGGDAREYSLDPIACCFDDSTAALDAVDFFPNWSLVEKAKIRFLVFCFF